MVIWGRNTPRSSRFSHLDTTRIIGGSGITRRGISVRQQKISIRASSMAKDLWLSILSHAHAFCAQSCDATG
jgi:hypothetical protein